ncbi:MAG: hypothetical protein Fur0037_28660 [Planctomycetota bacterium]
MQLQTCLLATASLILAAPATAQLTHVIPNGFATAEGSTSNAFPWSSSSAAWGGLHTTTLYDSTNFTNASINTQIVIQRLRWRADGRASGWTGGSFRNAVVQMATAAVDAMAPAMTFAQTGGNFGPDLTTVYAGPVTVQTASPSTPGPWIVDVTLSTPFLYDPAAGDLAIDVDISNAGGTNWSGGLSPQLDVDGSASTLASRVYGSSLYPNPNGTTVHHGVICEVTFVPAAGYAYASPYGQGCPALSGVAVYELFAPNTFDLSNTSLLFLPGGNGSYVIVGGPNIWFTGYTNNLGLSDDSVAQVTSPFPFPHSGGSTTTLSVSSNGFVWLGSNASNACCTGSVPAFLSSMARIAASWGDLNPAAGGGVYADLDAATGEYVITWAQVPEYGQPGTVDMQIALQQNGIFEMRFGNCTIANHTTLTGYSMGSVPADPGPSDLSTAPTVPITTGNAAVPLLLAASARPVLGTSINLDTSRIPSGSLLGGNFLGVIAHDPGIPLDPFGAPGCSQYITPAFSTAFAVTGPSVSTPLAIPNNPALAGVRLVSQSVSLSPGINAMGIAFTNGMHLMLDVN